MNPESGLDGVRHIGIRGGTIEVVSTAPLEGARVVDATGYVVSPGFIDLHEHGQQEESYRMMVRDGVTSAFELEVGTADVAEWYRAARVRRRNEPGLELRGRRVHAASQHSREETRVRLDVGTRSAAIILDWLADEERSEQRAERVALSNPGPRGKHRRMRFLPPTPR